MKKIIAIVLTLIMTLSLMCGIASAEETYNIGIIQLIQHPALDSATQGFQDALTEKLGDAVTFDYQNAQGDTANCATIINGFVSGDVDLILANATAALQAAFNGTMTIPILGTSITDYGTALGIEGFTGVSGFNVSGTCDLAPLDQQAALLNTMFPDAKTVGLVYCSAEANSIYQIDVIEPILQGMGYVTERYAFSDSNDLASVVTVACENSDVIYIPTDNTAANNTELINNICLPAKTPIIIGEEGMCKGCGVATLCINYYDIGYAAGLMAYEILVNDADVSTMPIQYAPEVIMKYNPVICEELGITPPEGAVAIEMDAE